MNVRKELKKYSNNLFKKQEIVVFNKIDLLDNLKIKERVNKLHTKIKKPISKISALKKIGISELKIKLINHVYR